MHALYDVSRLAICNYFLANPAPEFGPTPAAHPHIHSHKIS